MTWTCAQFQTHCGRCNRVLQPGDPMALLTQAKRVRCADCAPGSVDWQEVENERWRLKREAAQASEPRQVAPPVPRAPRPVSRWSAVSDLVATVDPRLPRGDRE